MPLAAGSQATDISPFANGVGRLTSEGQTARVGRSGRRRGPLPAWLILHVRWPT